MGFLEVLTIIFIVLKLIGVIGWSWFFVLLPLIISLSFYLVMALLIFTGAVTGFGSFMRRKRK